jgi:hypothetical protein
LGNSIDTAFVDLKGGTTGQVLSKNSNTDLDYTWVAQDDSNAIQNAIIDAKGDLIVGTAADTPARLAVGANDTLLIADSSTATGLKWGTISGGGMTLLSTTNLSGTATTISSISQAYTDLVILVEGAVWGTGVSALQIRPNGSATGWYARAQDYQGTSSVVLTSNLDTIGDTKNTGGNNVLFGIVRNYTNTSYRKSASFVGGGESGASSIVAVNGGGMLNTTSAITSITIDTFNAYTFSAGQVKIWGVK